MDNSQIIKILNESPSVKLLKSRNVDFVLCFLSDVFPDNNAVNSERLHMLLENRLDDMDEPVELDYDQPQKIENNEDKAKRWILQWVNNGFLTNYQDETGNIMYEISSYSIKVLDWVESLKKEEYIGTESKFKALFNLLKELVEFTNEDREKRLQILIKRKLEIEHEIQRLEMGEDVLVFKDYEIEPRFNSLNKLAKELLSDFKEVDNNFKDIIKQIYQRQINNPKKKEILNYIFDAYGELKNSSQGKSFYSFWEFLLSSGLQNQWDELINDLYGALEDRGLDSKDMFLKNIKQYLYSAGEKVSKTNDRMSEKLSRIIRFNEKSNAEATKRVIDEIKHSLIEHGTNENLSDVSLESEEINLYIPFDRQLQTQLEKTIVYNDIPSKSNIDIMSLENIKQLFVSHHIDERILRSRIDAELSKFPQITLAKIIDSNKLTKGLPELFEYISILKDYRTVVNNKKQQTIIFSSEEGKAISIPEIIIMR